MKGLNDNEINDFIAWTKDTPVHVRFIEFMPFDGNRWTSNKVITLQQILNTVSGSMILFRCKAKSMIPQRNSWCPATREHLL